MEKIPTPQQPDDIQKEAADFYKKEDEKAVDELQEAFNINRLTKSMVEYMDKGFLSPDMPLIEALEKLEKKKFELIGTDPEAEEGGDEEEGEEKNPEI